MGVQPSGHGGEARTTVPGGLARRFAGRVIDFAIVTIVGAVPGVLLDFGFVWLALQAVGTLAYFVLFDAYAGTTPGKRLLKMRVERHDGGRPTIGEATRREAFTLLGAIPIAGPVLALAAWVVIAVTINSSPTKQGKHDDLAGGTRVVMV